MHPSSAACLLNKSLGLSNLHFLFCRAGMTIPAPQARGKGQVNGGWAGIFKGPDPGSRRSPRSWPDLDGGRVEVRGVAVLCQALFRSLRLCGHGLEDKCWNSPRIPLGSRLTPFLSIFSPFSNAVALPMVHIVCSVVSLLWSLLVSRSLFWTLTYVGRQFPR